MKKIPNEFGKNGYKYKLIKRLSNKAIYEQFSSKGLSVGYEVHIIRIRPPGESKYDVLNEGCERLAGNENFGKYGWYFQSYNNAINKFDGIKSD